MQEKHQIAGEELWLLAQKAMYWPARRVLFVADTHFGKVGHFRKHGIKIPTQAAEQNFSRMEALLTQIQPQEVYFLGDLFHSEMNQEWLQFKQMIALFPACTFHLIGGNHDILDQASYYRARLEFHPHELSLGPFLLSHEPLPNYQGERGYNLCGHIHPGVRLRGLGRQSLRLACFHFMPHQGILPAFGAFTGTALREPKKADQVFVVLEDKVIEIS